MCKKIIFLHLFIFLSGISALFAQVSSETKSPEIKSSEIKELSACEGRVNLICENASGTLFAASDSACVNIYDERDWSLVCRFYDEGVARISFFTEGDSEFFITMTKDGQYIVRKLNLYDDVWHCEDGEPYFSADCADVTGKKSLTAVSFSNNSDYVAAAFSDNSIQVHFRLSITAGSISRTILNHKTSVYGLEFSKNGEYLASVSTDGEAYIWNSYTTSKITQLKGIYSRARVPVYFTEDSVYIISLDGRNSFRISDFSGNTLYSILTGRPITAIKPLKNPDLLAIRNDKNEVMVYSISSRRPLSVTSAVSESDFTTFDFNPDADLMYAAFANGKVSFIEPLPYLDDTSMLVTDSTLIGNGLGGGAGDGTVSGNGSGGIGANRFQIISICGGAHYLVKPYLVSGDLRGEYLYSDVTAPIFIGGGLNFGAGFPRKDFPSQYKVNGNVVSAPNLLSGTLYTTAGYAISPLKGDIKILTDVKVGAKMSGIALITNAGSAIGKPVFSFFMSVGVGMQVRCFTFDINCEYDTLGKVSPSLYAGYVLFLGKKEK